MDAAALRFGNCPAEFPYHGIVCISPQGTDGWEMRVLLPNPSEEHMPSAISISNRLLATLTAEDLDRLRPHLEAVPLPHKQTRSKPDTPIE